MADNATLQSSAPATAASGTVFACPEASYSGDTAKVTLVALATVTGSEGARTATDLSDTNPVPTKHAFVASATLSDVSQSASSQTLSASLSTRRGLVIHNDAADLLYLKYGSTASASSFTDVVLPSQTWRLPDPYYGIVTGIWANAGSGAARVTEL
jgi:hypothetical protein